MSVIVLLALWRGRDRAAAGLVLWGIAFLAGLVGSYVPADGQVGLAWQNILARESQAFVRAVAQGTLKPDEAREPALQLDVAASAS